MASELRQRGDDTQVLSTLVLGNHCGYREFADVEHGGGILVGTKGLWQGVDVADEKRLHLVWINKLPFAPFAAPIIEARREAVKTRAEAARAEDPDAVATQSYYLPLAALQLRQAVGRLIRSERHRGVIVISDRKLAGQIALRRLSGDFPRLAGRRPARRLARSATAGSGEWGTGRWKCRADG